VTGARRAAAVFAAALVVASMAGPALADCVLNGVSYPEGTVVGNYVCKDGRWQKR
jgi:hypothetical protein